MWRRTPPIDDRQSMAGRPATPVMRSVGGWVRLRVMLHELAGKVMFEVDSSLEGGGFELSVPRVMGGRFRTTVPAAIAVFEVAGTAVALPRHQGGWPRPSSRIPR